MPRKALTSEQELTTLKEQQPILEEHVRMATRALNANLAQQRAIVQQQTREKRIALGTALDDLGLTADEIKALVEQAQRKPTSNGVRDDG